MIPVTDEMVAAIEVFMAPMEEQEDTRRGLAAVLAIVERDLALTCLDTVETRGEWVRCTKKLDGHDTHLGRSSAGWDVIW